MPTATASKPRSRRRPTKAPVELPDVPRVEERLDDLITGDEAAKGFKRTPQTIELWYKNKGLPHVRLPGTGKDAIRYRPDACRKWGEAHGLPFSG